MKRIFAIEGNYVEGSFRIVHMTDRAYLLDYGDGQAWVPRSQVLDVTDNQDGTSTVTMPEWLAIDKGLV